MQSCLVGIDLGGTFIKTALVSRDGAIIQKVEVPTEGEKGPDGVIANICRSVEIAVDSCGMPIKAVQAIGIGSPGPINTRDGIVCRAINIPGWLHIRLRDRVSQVFGIPANLENDANAAAYGEYWKGAGKGSRIMVAYTLGTGVGGGIIIHGKLLRGTSDVAGELGHIPIIPDGDLCSCGAHGCLEAYASATAVVKRTGRRLDAGEPSILSDWIARGQILTSRLVDEARLAGDALAADIMRETGVFLGVGITGIVNAVNPDIVVVGGGMMKAGEVILIPAREEVVKRVFPELSAHLKIVPAALGNDAGVIGSAGLLFERGIVT